jgi:opacity protein-like surface antigen
MKSFFTSILFIFCLCSLQVSAQDCSENLIDAETAYEDGKLNQSLELLTQCENSSSLSLDEKVRLNRLKCIILLYQNEDDRATEAMQRLLRINPEYKIKPTDPSEFLNLYKKFKIIPYLIVGGALGGNLSFVEILKAYSTDAYKATTATYNSKLGFQVVGFVARPITRHLELRFEPGVTSISYSRNQKMYDSTFSSVLFTESHLRIDAPILLKYSFRDRYNFDLEGLFPYVSIGGGASYLISATSAGVRNDDKSERSNDLKGFSLNKARNQLNYFVTLGGGVEYKIKLGHLFLDVRYQAMLLNGVKTESRQEYETTQPLIFSLGMLGDDFKLNGVTFSVGYNYPLFNPRVKKNKNKKTTSVNSETSTE